MLHKQQHYINGAWVDSQGKEKLEVINPSNEQVCGFVSSGTATDISKAVTSATAAFDSWRHLPPAIRLAFVEKIHTLYLQRAEEMAQLISLEMGAPIDMARHEQVKAGSQHIENFIHIGKNFAYEVAFPHNPAFPHNRDHILLEPVGICGLITPWNWPMNQITLKVIPALMAGCTLILKPSELAPFSSMLFAEILDEAGIPAGVFNLVNGDGKGVGAQLAGHRNVDMISFTGSTDAGIEISKNAANSLKRVHLELGGKGANLFFADAGPDAIKSSIMRMFNNSGQSCDAPSRLLVERAVYEQTVAAVAALTRKVVVGANNQSGNHIGPVVSKRQFDKIQSFIQAGMDEGARLVVGGVGRPDGFDRGYYVKPTVFADVHNGMRIAREEIFGPVLSIIPFDKEEEAISIANDTVYGLTNFIQSGDRERCQRIARQLRSGMVEINGCEGSAGSPFGGMKASGNGREGGIWGLEDFLEVKSISGWS